MHRQVQYFLGVVIFKRLHLAYERFPKVEKEISHVLMSLLLGAWCRRRIKTTRGVIKLALGIPETNKKALSNMCVLGSANALKSMTLTLL